MGLAHYFGSTNTGFPALFAVQNQPSLPPGSMPTNQIARISPPDSGLGRPLPQPQHVRRLLWVDDSPALLSLYQAVFGSLGFEVVVTPSPVEALDRLSWDHFDVAILDYDMPEIDGGTLASWIKNRLPKLPVILYTGSTSIPRSARRCVDVVCAKAAPPGELLSVIERLWREPANRRASFHPPISFPPGRALAQQS